MNGEKHSRIVLFGECMVELATQSAITLERSFAGDTYNTAVYLKRCSPMLSVSYFTAIGDDFLSNELLFKMGDEQINTDYVFRCNQHNLGLYLVKRDQYGEQTFAYWRDNSAATQTFNAYKGQSIHANYFYFSGISLGILDDEQRQKLFKLLEQLKCTGTSIVFDPNYRQKLWQDRAQAQFWTDKSYAISDIVFPGSEDHLALYDHVDTEQILSHLSTFDIREIVIKNGANGVNIFYANERFIVPTVRVNNIVDTTAAGDAFNAGYIACRINGGSIIVATNYAAKVAAVVIGCPGAIIDSSQFKQLVHAYNGN